MALAFRCILLLGLSWPALARAQDEGIGLLRTRLASRDAKTSEKALHALLALGDEGRAAAREVLEKLCRERAGELEGLGKPLDGAFDFLDDAEAVKEIEEKLLAHRTLSKEILDFAFDEGRYPFPARPGGGWRPGFDYQKGQLLLEGRVEAAVRLSNELEPSILGLFGGRARAEVATKKNLAELLVKGELVEDGTALSMLQYRFTDGTREWARIGKKIARSFEPYAEGEALYAHTRALGLLAAATPGADAKRARPIAAAAGALFAGRYDDAAKARHALRPFERRIFDILVARRVLLLNETPEGHWSKIDLAALKTLNLYRIAIGLWPLKTNLKLFAAAYEHGTHCSRVGRLAHERPEPERKTCNERARTMGYPGTVRECLAYGCGGGVVFEWRCDAGHHRSLIWPEARAAGIATVGSVCTYNPGDAVETPGLAALMKE